MQDSSGTNEYQGEVELRSRSRFSTQMNHETTTKFQANHIPLQKLKWKLRHKPERAQFGTGEVGIGTWVDQRI